MRIILKQPLALNELGRRECLEDSVFPAKGAAAVSDRLFVVCDGMGGYENGEIASRAVCDAFALYFKDRGLEPFNEAVFNEALVYAYSRLDMAAESAVSIAQADSDSRSFQDRGMGTTLALVCFHSGGVSLAHIGDSRIYQLRKQGSKVGILHKSRDHSHVNELVRAKVITPEEAAAHPKKNLLTRAMRPGQEKMVLAEYSEITGVAAEDYFFICTDGILEALTDDGLCAIVGRDAGDESKLDAIYNICLNGSNDNFSAYLIPVGSVMEEYHNESR
jgi:protein phosphatase